MFLLFKGVGSDGIQNDTAIRHSSLSKNNSQGEFELFELKGQMHHHNDLGSKCAYTCHLSNKTTRKSVLLSTPQIWLMKVSKKTSLSLGMEADIAGQLSPIKHNQWYEVTASAASDWLRDISDCH